MNQLQSTQKKQGSVKNPTHQTGHSPGLFKANMHPYLQAQGIIGNHGILRRHSGDIIQAKLKIGQPNDKYEQEADRVADQVMSMPEPGMQRKSTCPECEEETNEAAQPKPIADQITPLVQRQEDTGSEEEPEEEDENYMESVPTRDAGELGEEEEEETLQSKSSSSQIKTVTPTIESRIQSLKGGGQPLPKSVRNFFEPRFGADFSDVRVHTDSRATETAKSINAKAFTTGKDMVFGSGQYSPGIPTGKRLLAHELTHTIQQSSTKNRRMHGFKDIARNLVIQRDCSRTPKKLKNKRYKFKFTTRSIISSATTFKVKGRVLIIKIRGKELKGPESKRYFFMRIFVCYRKKNGQVIDYGTGPKMKIPKDYQYHYNVHPGKGYPYYYYFKIWVPKRWYDFVTGDGEIVERY